MKNDDCPVEWNTLQALQALLANSNANNTNNPFKHLNFQDKCVVLFTVVYYLNFRKIADTPPRFYIFLHGGEDWRFYLCHVRISSIHLH